MDLINLKNVKAATEEILITDLQSNRNGSEFPALEEWEMVLASGGEGMPVWG